MKTSLFSAILLFVAVSQAGDVPSARSLTRQAEVTAPLPASSADLLDQQARRELETALQLVIRHEGWYHVFGQELLAAGLDPQTDPRRLQLFVDGKPISMLVTGEQDGRLDPTDAVEFYGIGIDASVTDRRVYWLVAGSQPGKRIPKARAEGPAASSSSFPFTAERKERSIYFSALRNGDKENYFGPAIAKTGLEQNLFLHHLDAQADGKGIFLEVAVQGMNAVSHRVSLELNGQPVGEISFSGQAQGRARIPLAPELLKEGKNRLRLSPMAGETDVSLIDVVRLTYPHTYTADDDSLRCIAPGRQQVRMEGFRRPEIRVLDVTSPDDVVELEGRSEKQDKGAYSFKVTPPQSGSRMLLAFSPDAAKKPGEIRFHHASRLRQKQSGVDLIVLSKEEFFQILEPLRALRQKQGLRGMLVDVQDVFDEFSFGHRTPQALKDFLQYAAAQWQTKPRFVLLAGDASLDPKGYQRPESADLVPTKLVDTEYMETASDDWLADFDGDGLAEMAVGRLPFNTVFEAKRMVAKIVESETKAASEEVLLVSDDSFSGYDFVEATAKLRPIVPAQIKVEQIERGKSDGAAAKRQLLQAINRGQKIVNYMGHGSVDIWRGNLLTAAEAKSLTNGSRLPIFVMMTCLNGYFVDPALDSVAEGLMKAEHGGAMAVWTSSGQTEPFEQLVLHQEFLKLAFRPAAPGAKPVTLGEAALKAKAAVTNADICRTWILFGDPSMPLR